VPLAIVGGGWWGRGGAGGPERAGRALDSAGWRRGTGRGELQNPPVYPL